MLTDAEGMLAFRRSWCWRMLTYACLQEELDAYDTRQMELEDEMDKKVLTLLALLVQKYKY